ncbi:MAG: RecX family transcriptional regulator [Christensenellales bacterium]
MSEITALEVQKKDDKRANLYLDDKFYAGVSIELIMKYQLKKGMEINKDFLDEIVFEDEKGKALNKAVKYIGSNLKTTKQIKEYLTKKEYSPQTIDYVINKMLEYKYLDDRAYSKAFISTYSNKYGKIKLISALKSKGVSDEIIDDVFSSQDLKMENSIDTTANKYLKNKIRTEETYLKLSRFLYSRGYEFDDIKNCINRLKGEK